MVQYEYYFLYKDLSYRPEYHALMLMHCGLYIFHEGCEVYNEVRAESERVRFCHRHRDWMEMVCLQASSPKSYINTLYHSGL